MTMDNKKKKIGNLHHSRKLLLQKMALNLTRNECETMKVNIWFSFSSPNEMNHPESNLSWSFL